jgi:hypothetical protein
MSEAKSDEMRFEMTRDPEPGLSFSAEGLRQMGDSIAMFLGARTLAHFKKVPPGEPGPHAMHVKVTVTLDGESWPNEDDPWFSFHDPAHRAGALQ